jgi:dimeric dUTPase (all-alpha-NTP-PPase superfamily)
MTEQEKLKEMFTLQQKLNDETNGEGWENGYTKQNRLINWRRCTYMELAELIDSFNWKHWKDINIAPDWDNVKIEVVDIWHFIMSQGLEEYKVANKGNIDDIVRYVIDCGHFNHFVNEPAPHPEEDIYIIISTIEHFMKNALTGDSFDKLIDDFFEVALLCGVNFNILYKYYLGKNVLNKFRQDHGYKEGTYIKTWNGKEDNEVMLQILESKPLTADELYSELKGVYDNLS